MRRVRSRWEKTARSPGAAGAGGRRRRRPAGPLCAARVRARAKAARSWVSLGLGSKRITRRAMTSTSVSLAWSLPDSTNLSPVKVMAGRSFFSCARERASVSAPRATACHCTRCGRAHRVGQKEHRRGKRRAPGEHGGAPRPSPRSAQVTIHHPGHVHVQPALADSGYPARPGRLGGRLRGGGVQRARLQLHRQGQAVRALRPPSSANMYRFHASGAKATVTRRSTTPNENASQTPPDSVWVWGLENECFSGPFHPLTAPAE